MLQTGFYVGFLGDENNIIKKVPSILEFARLAKFERIVFFFFDKTFVPENLLKGDIHIEKHISLFCFSKKFSLTESNLMLSLFDVFGFDRIELWRGKKITIMDANNIPVKVPQTQINIDRSLRKVWICGLLKKDLIILKQKFSNYELKPSESGKKKDYIYEI